MKSEVASRLNRLVESGQYRMGNFMCHVLSADPADDVALNARAAIQTFMAEIVMRYTNQSTAASIALGSNLHRAVCNRLGMQMGRRNNYEQQGKEIVRLCKLKSAADYKIILHTTAREIYRDWDNRFAHVEAMLDAFANAAAQ